MVMTMPKVVIIIMEIAKIRKVIGKRKNVAKILLGNIFTPKHLFNMPIDLSPGGKKTGTVNVQYPKF